MPIEFRCHQCNKLLRVGDETAGKQAKCPSCGAVQTIPTPALPSAAPLHPAAPPSPTASDNPYASPLPSAVPLAGQYYDRFPPSRRTGPPWERDGASFSSFYATVTQTYTEISVLFSEMRREGGLGAPLLYAMAGSMIGNLAALACQGGLQLFLMSLARANGAGPAPGQPSPVEIMFFLALYAFIGVPVGMLIYMFVYSGIYHLMLMMLGAARWPFETTFRVVAYSLGSASLLGLIPFCGQAISGIVHLVFVAIGLSLAHEISGVKSAFAVILPFLVCCGGVFVLYIATMAAIVAGAR